MYGGFKRIHKKRSSFDAVLAMIKHPDVVLTGLSYASLSGFLFRLDVPTLTATDDATQFLGLNASGTAFNQPITTLVFKFALIIDDYDAEEEEKADADEEVDADEEEEVDADEEEDADADEEVPNKKEIPVLTIDEKKYEKKTESLRDFAVEAVVQQQIYLKTLTPNGKPICLSVADFSYFDNQSGQQFLYFLKSKSQDHIALSMLDYLVRTLSRMNHLKLGMISMELAESSSLMNKSSITQTDCKRTLAQIIILFIQLKWVNFDCHRGNVMKTRNTSYLIDFGRVVEINETMTPTFKQTYSSLSADAQASYDDDFLRVKNITITDFYMDAKNEQNVIDTLINVIKFIKNIDLTENTIYTGKKRDSAQMQHVIDCIFRGNASPHKDLIEIANVIQSLTQVPISKTTNALSQKAIQRMIRDKRIFSFQNPNIQYYNRSGSSFLDEEKEEEKEEEDDIPSPTTKSRKRGQSFKGSTLKRRRTPESPSSLFFSNPIR